MRLPLSAYVVIEQASDYPYKDPHLPRSAQLYGKTDVPISAWTNLPLALVHMPALRHLDIWLDHGSSTSWSIVNERAFLTPLFTIPHHINPNLSISMNLPKLSPNPKRVSPDWYFLEDRVELQGAAQEPGTERIKITRRYRQRQPAINWIDRTAHINWISDTAI